MITLNNGLHFKSIQRNYTNTVALVVMVNGGLFKENPSNNGIGSLFKRVWLKSGKLMELTEFYGGLTGGGVSNDYLEYYLSIPSMHLGKVLGLLEELLTDPVFDKKIFEQEKYLALQELEADKDDPGTISSNLFNSITYGTHPYGYRPDGTPESIENIGLEDIRTYYDTCFSSGDMCCTLAGRFTPEEQDQIKNSFNKIKNTGRTKISCEASEIIADKYVEEFDNRIQQTKLLLGYTAPPAVHGDYVSLKVLNEILGGGMSSAYFSALRKEKGYAYSVGTAYPSLKCSSRFIGYIGLNRNNIDDAANTMKYLNKNYVTQITSEELNRAQNHIAGQILSQAETNQRQAWFASFFADLGLGFDYLEEYVRKIKEVKTEDLQRAAGIFDKPFTLLVYGPETL